MSRISFSESNEWRLANPAFDMRGLEVYSSGGVYQGKVVEMLLQPETREVSGIVLESGRIFSARHARIADGKIYAEATRSQRGEHQVMKDFGQPVRIVPARGTADGGVVDFDKLFRRHFDAHYGDEAEYEHFQSAYQLGRRAALQGGFVGRPYRDARSALRSQYRPTNGEAAFPEAEDAIRYAFEQVSEIMS